MLDLPLDAFPALDSSGGKLTLKNEEKGDELCKF